MEVVALNQVVVGVRFPQDVLQIEAPGAVDHRVHLGEGQVFHGSPMAHALDLPRGVAPLGDTCLSPREVAERFSVEPWR